MRRDTIDDLEEAALARFARKLERLPLDEYRYLEARYAPRPAEGPDFEDVDPHILQASTMAFVIRLYRDQEGTADALLREVRELCDKLLD